MSIESNEAPNLIWGATAIAKVIGRSERAMFHLLEKQLLPAKRHTEPSKHAPIG
jgi:hypothetical protein